MTDTPGQADDPRHLEALRDTRDSLAAHDIGGDRMVTLSTNVLGAAVADLNAVIAALTPAADYPRVALRRLVETHLLLITDVVTTPDHRLTVIVDEDCTEVAMSARTLADHVVAGLTPASPAAVCGAPIAWDGIDAITERCERLLVRGTHRCDVSPRGALASPLPPDGQVDEHLTWTVHDDAGDDEYGAEGETWTVQRDLHGDVFLDGAKISLPGCVALALLAAAHLPAPHAATPGHAAPGESGEGATDDERLRDRIDAVLNPSDDDADEASVYAAAVERIAAYVASQPCICTPAAADPLWLADPCERCSVLGRRADQPENR